MNHRHISRDSGIDQQTLTVADLNPNDRVRSMIGDVTVIREEIHIDKSPINHPSSKYLELPSRKYMTMDDKEKLKELIDSNKS